MTGQPDVRMRRVYDPSPEDGMIRTGSRSSDSRSYQSAISS